MRASPVPILGRGLSPRPPASSGDRRAGLELLVPILGRGLSPRPPRRSSVLVQCSNGGGAGTFQSSAGGSAPSRPSRSASTAISLGVPILGRGLSPRPRCPLKRTIARKPGVPILGRGLEPPAATGSSQPPPPAADRVTRPVPILGRGLSPRPPSNSACRGTWATSSNPRPGARPPAAELGNEHHVVGYRVPILGRGLSPAASESNELAPYGASSNPRPGAQPPAARDQWCGWGRERSNPRPGAEPPAAGSSPAVRWTSTCTPILGRGLSPRPHDTSLRMI